MIGNKTSKWIGFSLNDMIMYEFGKKITRLKVFVTIVWDEDRRLLACMSTREMLWNFEGFKKAIN